MTATPFPVVDRRAPCRHGDPKRFFPDQPKASAGTVCRGCPFLDPCLAFALANAVEGVWGATTAQERRRLRRRLSIVPQRITGPDERPIWQQVVDAAAEGVPSGEIADALGIKPGVAYTYLSRYRARARAS